MSLIPTIYSSEDPGAPVLTGLAGSLAALLDAILVNGYGSGSTAKAGMGWTRPYTGTNLRAYRNNTVSGLGYYLRLDDTQTRVGRLRIYTAMTAISTGSGMAPTTSMRTNGALWVKSDTADSVARKWWAIGNERCFYLFMAPVGQDQTGIPEDGAQGIPHFAGRLRSRKPGDQYDFAVSLGMNAYNAGDWPNTLSWAFRNIYSGMGWSQGVYQSTPSEGAAVAIARGYLQTGNPVVARIGPDIAGSQTCWGGEDGGAVAYPDPVSGGLILSPGLLVEGVSIARAYYPGLWVPAHARPLSDLQIETNIPGLPAGTKLLAKSYRYAPTYPGGQVMFDIANEW